MGINNRLARDKAVGLGDQETGGQVFAYFCMS